MADSLYQRLLDESQDNTDSLYWQAASEIETLRARVAELEPIPTNGEHSDKCWQRAGHHHCAVLRIHKLERELAGYRKAERDMNEALNMGDGSYRP